MFHPPNKNYLDLYVLAYISCLCVWAYTLIQQRVSLNVGVYGKLTPARWSYYGGLLTRSIVLSVLGFVQKRNGGLITPENESILGAVRDPAWSEGTQATQGFIWTSLQWLRKTESTDASWLHPLVAKVARRAMKCGTIEASYLLLFRLHWVQ